MDENLAYLTHCMSICGVILSILSHSHDLINGFRICDVYFYV